MDSNKIGKTEAISMIIILMITHIIINLPLTLIKSTGSSTALNVIYISLIALVFCLILSKLFSLFPGCDIFDIAEFLAGKWLKITLQILFMLYLISMVAVVLRVFTLNLQIIYFTNLDIATILIVFLIGGIIINQFGFRTIIKSTLVFLPIILIAMFVLFASTLDNFGIEKFLPVFGNGFDETFISGISNLFAFSEINILFLLMPHLKDPKEFKKISLISIGISSIYLFLAVIASMFLIPANMSFEPIFSVYFSSRRIALGDVLERLDPIFVLVWIISIFCYVAIWMFYISNIFKKSIHVQTNKPIVYSVAALLFTFSLLIKNAGQITYIFSTFYKYMPLLFSFGLCFGILLVASIKKKFFSQSTNSKFSVELNS